MKGNHNRHPHTKQIFCSHHQTTCKLHKSWINYSLHHLSLKIEKKTFQFFLIISILLYNALRMLQVVI